MFEPTKILPLKHAASTIIGPGFLRRRRYLLAAGVLVIVVAVGLSYRLTRDSNSNRLATQRVLVGDVEDTVSALGTVQPLQFVDVGTQVSGQLKKLHVTYGDNVKQGQLLAEIDPVIYEARVSADQAQLLNLRAQVAQRKAERLLADQQLQRQKEMLKENATSQDAYDTADSKLNVSVAQIAALEAQIQQTESGLSGDQANLGYTKIYAPMTGTVVNIIAKQGQTLNANQTAPIVLRIADLDTMTVWAQVSEADIPRLKLGMKVYFTTLGLSEKRHFGTLRQIIPTPEIVNSVVLYDCLFDVENSDHDLLTQMSAQVYFVVGEAHKVPVAPMAALRPVGGRSGRNTGRYTARVLENGNIVSRDVQVGVVNRLQAEIKSGLNDGDEVLLDGARQPGGGQRPNQQQGQGPGGFPGGGGPPGIGGGR